MNRLKRLTEKLKLGSLYFRWIILFMFLIMLAHFITLFYVAYKITPQVEQGFRTHLLNKAEFIQELALSDYAITDDTLRQTGDLALRITVFDEDTVDKLGDLQEEITLSMLARAAAGEILIMAPADGIMACLFKAGEQYVLLSPDINNNLMALFVNAFHIIARLSSVLAAVFVVAALVSIIKPIKKVIYATVEVSKGNYDIQIKEKSSGDIGLLIKNFNKMASSLNKNEYLKKDFVANVSHEFKTPITNIEGFAKLLNSGGLSQEDMQEYTDIIIKEAARLSNMSTNLLKLSELDSNVFAPETTIFYLDEQIRNIILLLEAQWSEKNISFDIHMGEILVQSNEEYLFHIWYNLIQNAIKFSQEGDVVTIGAKKKDAAIRVVIQDSGPGMSQEVSEQIFNRFYQADSSHSVEGSGLGLSIVRRIVEILNGEITCESQLGKGTTFTVVLRQ